MKINRKERVVCVNLVTYDIDAQTEDEAIYKLEDGVFTNSTLTFSKEVKLIEWSYDGKTWFDEKFMH